jgi:hypothetical protein
MSYAVTAIEFKDVCDRAAAVKECLLFHTDSITAMRNSTTVEGAVEMGRSVYCLPAIKGNLKKYSQISLFLNI